MYNGVYNFKLHIFVTFTNKRKFANNKLNRKSGWFSLSLTTGEKRWNIRPTNSPETSLNIRYDNSEFVVRSVPTIREYDEHSVFGRIFGRIR